MKKLLLGAISFLVLFSACKDDDNVNSNTTPPEETQLVTPEVRGRIADPLNQTRLRVFSKFIRVMPKLPFITGTLSTEIKLYSMDTIPY